MCVCVCVCEQTATKDQALFLGIFDIKTPSFTPYAWHASGIFHKSLCPMKDECMAFFIIIYMQACICACVCVCVYVIGSFQPKK